MFAYAILLVTLLLFGAFCPSAKGLSRVPVRIHQRVFLHIPSIQLENGTEIGWFSCPTTSCHSDWNKHFLADIMFMTKVSVNNPNFDAYPNGTLAVKKVLPSHDGIYFIMRVHLKNRTSKAYSHQLKINEGEPPTLTLVSQQNIYVYGGMDLYLEAEVRAYPYPRVSLTHVSWAYQRVVRNISNYSFFEIQEKVPNITKSDDGFYIISAKNALGNHNLTVRVHVYDLSCSISTCTTPTGAPENKIHSSYDNPGDRGWDTYKVTTYVFLALLLLAVVYIIFLKRRTLLSFVTRTSNAQVINERNINLHV